MTAKLTLRAATRRDAVNLAIFMDMASQGLVSWLWNRLAEPGQSALELGRSQIRERTDIPSHFSNWIVAEQGRDLAGAFSGYIVPDPYEPGDVNDLPDVYSPLLELEAQAAGSWFLTALAVYPEFRRHGVGSALLKAAIAEARKSGASRITLTVGTANENALRLFLRQGFAEIARRAAVPYPGSGEMGEWVLLGRNGY